jgi:hypothetical protein
VLLKLLKKATDLANSRILLKAVRARRGNQLHMRASARGMDEKTRAAQQKSGIEILDHATTVHQLVVPWSRSRIVTYPRDHDKNWRSTFVASESVL